MKHLGKVITTVLTFALFGSLWATNVDTGWIKYTQPNGVTFTGRTWGNEFEHFRETKDGYRFVLNPDDNYYYYARLGAKGDYEASPFKVAIDVPQGIPKGLERSVARRAAIAEQRTQFEQEVQAVQLGSPSAPLSATFTLKVLLVEFQDVKHRNPNQDGKPAYTFQNFEDLFFSFGTYTNTSPDGEQVFGSMRDYYHQMSNGDLVLTGYVLNRDDNSDNVPDWLVLDYNKSAYGSGSRNLFTDALNKAAQQTPPLDTSTGTYTKLVVVYAGNWWLSGSLWPAAQPSSNRYRMSERLYYNADGQELTNAPFTHIGIHCHEFGHLLGFLDLYTGGNDHRWNLMNLGDKNGPSGIGGRTTAAPAPFNPEFRRQQGWISPVIINGSPQTEQADYSLQTPEVFQIDDPQSTYYWLIENRHFQDNDWNSWLPSAYPSFVNSQGILVWRMNETDDDFPEFIPADNDFHQAPDGTPSQGDHGDFFPGAANNLLFAPTTVPSSWPSDDDVAFEIISDNGISFTVDFYNSNAPNPPPAAPQNLVITNAGQNGQNVILAWDANTEPDLDHYAIYRGYQDDKFSPVNWLSNPVATTTSTTWTDPFVKINTSAPSSVHYRITAVDDANNESDYSNSISTHSYQVPKIGAPQLPEVIALHQNYPNPFNPATQIRFDLPEDAEVVLKIYNVLGEEVRTLVDKRMEIGLLSVSWDGKDEKGRDLPSGVYLYRFSVNSRNMNGKSFVAIKKLTLLR